MQTAAIGSGSLGALALAAALCLPGASVHAAARAPMAACTAAAPADGAVFSGPVLQVIDGRTLCVADGPTPDQWVRVRLADARDAAARGALMAAAFSKNVICIAGRRDGEGVIGRCVFNGASLGELVRSDEVKAQAASWR